MATDRRASRARRRRPGLLVLGVLIPALSGCDSVWVRGGWPKPVTTQAELMLRLWQGSLIAALAVGGFVLGLIVWACFRFRARGDQLPRQVRYNLPVEVLYTVIPVVIVAVLFYFTAIDEDTVDKLSAHPDLRVEVIGFQWSWQFNYPAQGLQITGRPGQPPQLVLPVGETIQFTEVSLDV
ncbi:MAG TPA: cytochrome c oxidase subunit II, partial [Mycobacteriales bacterium]|nr:cytochrome c oxidase subunit II [Mycobacteriales bacterium]